MSHLSVSPEMNCHLQKMCSHHLRGVSMTPINTVATALEFFSLHIYIYIYRKSAGRFSRGTVLNTLKQSRINIMRGKKDVTTFPPLNP